MLTKVAVIYKYNSPVAMALAKDFSIFLAKLGVDFVIFEAGWVRSCSELRQIFCPPGNPELVVVLGGDGTMLGVVREIILAGLQEVPILGVNMGNLGFLTALSQDELMSAIEKILNGEYIAPPRLMLKVQVQRGKKILANLLALNDIVVNKAALARIVNLKLYVDGYYLTTLCADGLIISTPTGSTAYNLSAGGPICYPYLDGIIVTPICSFALTNRPFLLNSDMHLSVMLDKKALHTSLTCDGQIGVNLLPGDYIDISRGSEFVRLIQSPYKNFFEILRAKLCWGECRN